LPTPLILASLLKVLLHPIEGFDVVALGLVVPLLIAFIAIAFIWAGHDRAQGGSGRAAAGGVQILILLAFASSVANSGATRSAAADNCGLSQVICGATGEYSEYARQYQKSR
jgi:hypothetical protein